jgi:Mg/Co/Ni transporter MgtE
MRIVLIAATFIITLALSLFHWAGLIAGGLIAGYFSRSLKEAVGAGFLLGVFVFLAFIVSLSASGILDKFIALSPLPYVSLILTLVLAVVSAAITNFFSPYALKQS